MSIDIVYDKDGKKVPSREFLSTIIVLLRRSEVEVDMPLIQWLEDLDKDIDVYDNLALRKAVHKYLDENYPDEQRQAS